MQPYEHMLEIAARRCRHLLKEIQKAIVRVEIRRDAIGEIVADARINLEDRSDALTYFEECQETLALLRKFEHESIVANEVLLRGSVYPFAILVQEFRVACEGQSQGNIHLRFENSSDLSQLADTLIHESLKQESRAVPN